MMSTGKRGKCTNLEHEAHLRVHERVELVKLGALHRSSKVIRFPELMENVKQKKESIAKANLLTLSHGREVVCVVIQGRD